MIAPVRRPELVRSVEPVARLEVDVPAERLVKARS
jgi:hypothetical protein